MQEVKRVGLYVKPDTRLRLNLYRSILAAQRGEIVSQDDALGELMDRAKAPELKNASLAVTV